MNSLFSDKLIEYNIFSICKGLLEVPELYKNDELTFSMITLIDFLIKFHPQNLNFEEVGFIQFILEEKVHQNSEYTINVLNLIMNLAYLSNDIKFDISIIEPIVGLLDFKKSSHKNSDEENQSITVRN
jgi:hypothetical protein